MPSNRYTFTLKSGLNIFKLDEPLHTSTNSQMLVRNLDVYWDFKNIETQSVINYGTDITFPPGYYTFEDLQKKLKENDITLTLNTYDNTCSIYGQDHPAKLGSTFGKLLGFTTTTTIAANTKTTSQQKVDLNLGFKYLTISCNIANIWKNFLDGTRSQNIANIPISTNQRLSGTVSHFSNRFSRVSLYNGSYREIGLDVSTNNKLPQNVEILLAIEMD